VLDVPKVRGLSLSFDYFHLNQNKVIENVGGQAAIDRGRTCPRARHAGGTREGHQYQPNRPRLRHGGYKGSSKIVRKPVTDADRLAFATYNAQQTNNNARRAVVGELVSVIDDYLNLSGRDIQGYEFGAQWRSPKTSYGQFTFNGDATHYVLRRSQADELGRARRARPQRPREVARQRFGFVAPRRLVGRLVHELLWLDRRHLGGDHRGDLSGVGSRPATSGCSTTTVSRATCSASIRPTITTLGCLPLRRQNLGVAEGCERCAAGSTTCWMASHSWRGTSNTATWAAAANPRGRQFTFEVSRKF